MLEKRSTVPSVRAYHNFNVVINSLSYNPSQEENFHCVSCQTKLQFCVSDGPKMKITTASSAVVYVPVEEQIENLSANQNRKSTGVCRGNPLF